MPAIAVLRKECLLMQRRPTIGKVETVDGYGKQKANNTQKQRILTVEKTESIGKEASGTQNKRVGK